MTLAQWMEFAALQGECYKFRHVPGGTIASLWPIAGVAGEFIEGGVSWLLLPNGLRVEFRDTKDR